MKLFIGLFLLLGQFAQAEVPQLVDVQHLRMGDVFVSELHFNRSVEKEEFTVDFINETVQVNIPGAKIVKKKFSKIKDDKVRSLYTYQPETNLLRHRVNLKKGTPALAYEEQVSISANGKTLRLQIGEVRESIGSMIQALPPKVEAKKKTKSVAKKKIDKKNKELSADEEALLQAITKDLNADAKKESAKEEPKESEIPVLAATTKKAEVGSSTYMRMLLSLGIVLLIALGAVFALKKYRHKGLSKNAHTNIRVLTQHYLGPKKSLAIISVAGESILVGVTDHSITHIKNLALLEEEIPTATPTDFSSTLEAEKKIDQEINSSRETSAPKDEFSMAGLKDLVSDRLNGMRDI